jgi:hypothetical protein
LPPMTISSLEPIGQMLRPYPPTQPRAFRSLGAPAVLSRLRGGMKIAWQGSSPTVTQRSAERGKWAPMETVGARRKCVSRQENRMPPNRFQRNLPARVIQKLTKYAHHVKILYWKVSTLSYASCQNNTGGRTTGNWLSVFACSHIERWPIPADFRPGNFLS